MYHRVTPSPLLHTDAFNTVTLHVIFRNNNDAVTIIHDSTVTPEIFHTIPESSMALYLPQDDDAYLFLFRRITLNDEDRHPPNPEQNNRIVDMLHWPNGNTQDEIQLNEILEDPEHNLVLDTQVPIEAVVFTFFNWGHLRCQLGLTPFSRHDLKGFCKDARARIVQARD
jgi:hypothetical protein